MCQFCGFEPLQFNSTEQYFEYMRIQNERLLEKNGKTKPSKEFMANPEWIRKNRILYSYNGNFNNLRDI